ncbi:hypothetical protein NLX83_35830 [Allokutzneria sp. A3M-2-11 16]|uniref:cytochrome P450 family protein n=1 Tax=Allokutzneria sp. A3M-2-11 16 TaxID=2962043 RepID=UPI0020B70457|nr:hypothetical protein [Allokutzneria sp. A3M-2-11 16]MCP3804655.1 hypothetical protein [Allokutzneria sp. A3M-2-11 16]
MTTLDAEPAIDRVLGRRLHFTRASHWFSGEHGDPYALLLRAMDDSTEQLVRARGPVHRADDGTWVIADQDLGADVLGDPRFGLRRADGAHPAQHVLPLENSGLHRDRADYERVRAIIEPVTGDHARSRVSAVASRLLGELGPSFDLADFARRLPAAVLTDLFELTDERFPAHFAGLGRTLDSVLCPQRATDTLRTMSAVDGLHGVFADHLAALTPEQAGPAPEDTRLAGMLLAVTTVEIVPGLICNAVLGAPDAPPVALESRVAHEPVELAGAEIAADDHVVVLAGGAATLDRSVHFGLAAPLIRLQAEVALELLPALRVTGPVVRNRRSPVLRSVSRLPVTAA